MRYLAESNCSTRFCRPLPNRSAKVPLQTCECKVKIKYLKCQTFITFYSDMFVFSYLSLAFWLSDRAKHSRDNRCTGHWLREWCGEVDVLHKRDTQQWSVRWSDIAKTFVHSLLIGKPAVVHPMIPPFKSTTVKPALISCWAAFKERLPERQ